MQSEIQKFCFLLIGVKIFFNKMGMKPDDPPIRAQCMQDTVTIHDVYRICETMVEDLTPYILNCLIECWHDQVITKKK